MSGSGGMIHEAMRRSPWLERTKWGASMIVVVVAVGQRRTGVAGIDFDKLNL